jgi:hypothetical protein
MSLTLRLAADLALALAARVLPSRTDFPPILELSADGHFIAIPEALAKSARGEANDFLQTLSSIARYRSPILWICGPEALDYPGVARLANSLAESGRHVFLENSGASLKPRLHEFKPSSRLYLAIRLNTEHLAAHQVSDHQAALRVGLEALRMARLAGFYTCARLMVRPETPVSGLEGLHAQIRKLDVDGVLITPVATVTTPEFEKQLRQWRRRFLNRRCALLSSLLEANSIPSASQRSLENEGPPLPDSRQDRLGESVEAG